MASQEDYKFVMIKTPRFGHSVVSSWGGGGGVNIPQLNQLHQITVLGKTKFLNFCFCLPLQLVNVFLPDWVLKCVG